MSAQNIDNNINNIYAEPLGNWGEYMGYFNKTWTYYYTRHGSKLLIDYKLLTFVG